MKLHRVNERIYRSDQPSLADLEELRRQGIDTIINLRRDDPKVWRAEREAASAAGIRFFHFPFYGVFGASDALLEAILAELTDPKNGVVLVHCREGKDRTSLIIGLYRVLFENMSIEEAWREEFVAYGHDPDNPEGAWKNPVFNYFYRNIRRTFFAYARTHGAASSLDEDE